MSLTVTERAHLARTERQSPPLAWRASFLPDCLLLVVPTPGYISMSSDAPPSYITGEDAGRTAARPPAYTVSTGLLPKQQPPTAQPHHAEYTRSINNEQRFQGYHTAAAATAAPASQTHPRSVDLPCHTRAAQGSRESTVLR